MATKKKEDTKKKGAEKDAEKEAKRKARQEALKTDRQSNVRTVNRLTLLPSTKNPKFVTTVMP